MNNRTMGSGWVGWSACAATIAVAWGCAKEPDSGFVAKGTEGNPTADDGRPLDGGSDDGSSPGDDGLKLDLGGSDTFGCLGESMQGPGPDAMVNFSNIWISNSPDGTVSKIDTFTAVEVGRFQVTPAPRNNVLVGPSRTSVSLQGDMAVADRSGGLAKVWADEADCADRNGNGVIDTSRGPGAMPFGDDECLAWQIEIPRMPGVYEDRRGPRTVQWTVPECSGDSANVWVAFCNASDDDATAWLVDGDTAQVLVEIPITGFNCEMMGPYGGGVDQDNNLWFIENDSRKALYRVEYDCEPGPGNPCWQAFDRPDPTMDPYGVTVDALGRVWMAGQDNSLYYYWHERQEWANFKPELDAFFATQAAARPDGAPLANNILRGVTMDADFVLWVATIQDFGGGPYAGILKVDTNSTPFAYTYYSKETLGQELQHAAGTSIDVEGNVWLVDTFGNAAYKIPPLAPTTYTRVQGLNQPYTYSDMTGFSLTQVAFPPTQ